MHEHAAYHTANVCRRERECVCVREKRQVVVDETCVREIPSACEYVVCV